MTQEAPTTPSFHVILTSIGRPTLRRMLDSLKSELTKDDALTIIFDGEEAFPKSGLTKEWLEGHNENVFIIHQIPNLGSWGLPILNKYQGLLMKKTTFIMNADDDDEFIQGRFAELRKQCTDPKTLYIGKMNYANDPKHVIPSQNKEIKEADIGKPNGIIPFDDVTKSTWGDTYTGDFTYYNGLKDKVAHVVFLDTIFYRVHHVPGAGNAKGGRRRIRNKTRRLRPRQRR